MAASKTLVYKLNPARGNKMRATLNCEDGWEFRKVDHAQFQVRGDGVVATLYNSGKLVVQGRNSDSFAVRLLGDLKQAPSKSKAKDEGVGEESQSNFNGEYIGSDEAGKGDSFGGMSVAAVSVKPDQVSLLKEAGVCDSKRIADQRIIVLAPWIRDNFLVAEWSLSAQAYNERYKKEGSNVNKLLTKMHSELLGELIEKSSPQLLVVDRFGTNLPLSSAMKPYGIPVKEIPRAEAWPAVAAASVLARDSFLSSLKQTSEKAGIDLPLGSGAPVKKALRQVKLIHGPEMWPKMCKMHFKNIQTALLNT